MPTKSKSALSLQVMCKSGSDLLRCPNLQTDKCCADTKRNRQIFGVAKTNMDLYHLKMRLAVDMKDKSQRHRILKAAGRILKRNDDKSMPSVEVLKERVAAEYITLGPDITGNKNFEPNLDKFISHFACLQVCMFGVVCAAVI